MINTEGDSTYHQESNDAMDTKVTSPAVEDDIPSENMPFEFDSHVTINDPSAEDNVREVHGQDYAVTFKFLEAGWQPASEKPSIPFSNGTGSDYPDYDMNQTTQKVADEIQNEETDKDTNELFENGDHLMDEATQAAIIAIQIGDIDDTTNDTFENGDYDMDEATLHAIIAAQMKDLEDAIDIAATNGKGKGRASDPLPDFQFALDSYRNHLLSISTIESDRRLAYSIDTAVDQDLDLLRQINAEETGVNDDLLTNQHIVNEAVCCSCLELRFCTTVPCGDYYCHICLVQVFKNACHDEEAYVF